MRQTAQEAQANGLTEERLQEILQELDEERGAELDALEEQTRNVESAQ